MLCLSFFFPVPALNLEFLFQIILANQSRHFYFNLFPAWVQVLIDYFCSSRLDESVVFPDFQKFEIGVTFIPEIKPTVCVH